MNKLLCVESEVIYKIKLDACDSVFVRFNFVSVSNAGIRGTNFEHAMWIEDQELRGGI